MLISGEANPATVATIEFPAVSNRTYAVQFSDRLSGENGVGAANWTSLREIVATPTNRVERVLDPASFTHRYYRVVTPAQP